MRKLILAIFAATMVVVAWSHNNPQRAKARHYLIEGYGKEADECIDEAYELYKKAYNTDSTYTEAAYAYAFTVLSLENDSAASFNFKEATPLLRRYVDKYAADNMEAEIYTALMRAQGQYDEIIRVYRRNAEIHPSKTHTLLALADAYSDNGQLDSALATLDRYQRIEGPSRNLLIQKMYYHMAMADTAGAFSEVDRMLAEYPTSADYNLVKGFLHYSTFNPDSAMYYYKRAEVANPDNGEVKMIIADLLLEQGDSVAYDSEIYDALLTDDIDLESKIEILANYLQVLMSSNSDTARGDHLFEVLNSQYPHEPEVLCLAAAYSMAKGEYEKAIESASYAIDQDPNAEDLWEMKMKALILDDRFDELDDTYRKALTHLSDRGLDMVYVSGVMISKDYPKAVAVCKEIIGRILPDIDPVNSNVLEHPLTSSLDVEDLILLSDLYSFIGDADNELGNIDSRNLAYDNSLRLNPFNDSVLNNYAFFLSNEGGDLDKALEMVETALSVTEDNPTYIDTKAWVLYRLGRYSEALETQREAVRVAEEEDSADAEFYNHLGEILLKNDLPDEAKEAFEKAKAIELEEKEEK